MQVYCCSLLMVDNIGGTLVLFTTDGVCSLLMWVVLVEF